MDKRSGLLIILICILIAAGVYNYYYFSTRRKPRPVATSSRPKIATTAKRMNRSPERQNRKGPLKTSHLNLPVTLPEGWGRNPFLTPTEIRQLRTSKDPLVIARPLPEYVVTSILISSSQKVAVIDGKILSPGDSIGRETVREISTEGVVLAKGGYMRTIKLRQGRTTIKARIP